MLPDLLALYSDLTDSKEIKITVFNKTIEIKIIALWFKNMDQKARLDYLDEAIEAIYPDLKRRYRFKFIALSPREQN